MRMRFFSGLNTLPLLCVFLIGCGGSSGSTVTGTVTFNGKPVENGQITFYPEGASGNPAGAAISKGKYTATGVPTGKCRVTVASSADSGGTKPAGMGEAVKEAEANKGKKRDTADEVQPNDDGNGQVHEIGSGSVTLDISIKTLVTSGTIPGKK